MKHYALKKKLSGVTVSDKTVHYIIEIRGKITGDSSANVKKLVFDHVKDFADGIPGAAELKVSQARRSRSGHHQPWSPLRRAKFNKRKKLEQQAEGLE